MKRAIEAIGIEPARIADFLGPVAFVYCCLSQGARMADHLPELSVWKLTLNGQQAQFLKSVAVPTETSIVIGFGITIGSNSLNDWAFQEMQGQRRIFAGNLITLDTSLRPVYCDAWDSAFIQQAEIAASDASQSALMYFTLNLQVTNLREVPIPSPGASAAGRVSLADSRKSQLRQRMFGRTVRSNLPAHTGRKDPLPYFASKVTVSGSSKEIFVSKLGTLTYSSGVIAPFVITMGGDQAADYRAWKQAGGQRDVTIRYLDTALRIRLTIVFGGCTIAQIVPAVPISVSGPTSVTLNVSRLTINY